MTGVVSYIVDPFPGLRPFEPEHSALFFGREEQTDELLRRLERARFLAIVGDSGSGKSSLVRAGLIPSLQRGYMAEAGSRWQIALFRPGDDPVGNLARALHASGKSNDCGPDALEIQKTLERNSMGLAQAAKTILPPKSNLLVVVDQFEEIFRYRRETQKRDGGDSAAAFVKLLLNASEDEDSVVNVVLTMRSDFLGECSQFRGLPETLNGGQYLVPRLSREQMKEAIEGPAAVAGADFAPMLVQRLLNDVGDNPDQLPVLQHALMRTWEESAASRERGEPITLNHYEAIGGISQALNRHVESAYQELSPEDRRIAKKLFQRLTERAKGDREIRRSTKVSELAAVAGETEERVIAVINKFREAGRTFLTSPDAFSLSTNSIIDITHESLIRLWDTLGQWVAEEADNAHLYCRLAESAVERRAAYHDQDLNQALAWRDTTRPNQAWAERYHAAFARAMEFLDWSWKLERTRRRMKTAAVFGLCITTVIAAGFAIRTLLQDRELDARRLLSDARTLQSAPGPALATGTLVAIESLQRNPLFDTESVLRADIALLPTVVATLRNDDKVHTLAFSPDGERLATGTDKGTVHIFETKGGKEVVHISGKTPVLSISFSPDGRFLARANVRGGALFDTITGRQVAALNQETPVYNLAFSPDGKLILTAGGDGTARMFESPTGREVWVSDQAGIVNAVAFSSDGQYVATASSDGTARILFAATGRQKESFQQGGEVRAVCFSRDGHFLATGGAATQDRNGAGVARVFNVSTGREIANIFHPGIVNTIAFNPDGTQLATGRDDGVARVSSTQNGNEYSRLNHGGAVNAVAFSPDGRWVATASSDHTGRLFEATTGKEIARMIHEDEVRSVTFSPDGKLVATGSYDHTARIFAALNGNATVQIAHDNPVVFSNFSPDGRLVATGTRDGVTRVVEPVTGRQLARLLRLSAVGSVGFSPDGKLLAVGAEDGRTIVFNSATGGEVGGAPVRSADEGFPVVSLAFSPDGTRVASGHQDGLLQVLEARGGREVLHNMLGSRTLMPSDAIRIIQFSPDGAMLMTGSDEGSVHVFDAATGREIAHYGHQDKTRTVAFNPNPSRTIAISASYDGTIMLVDVSSGKVVQQITDIRDKFNGEVHAVAFSHDGSLFAVGSSIPKAGSRSGIIQIFETDSGKVLSASEQSRPVERVVFSPDDLWVAAASDQQEIQVLRAADALKVALITADQIKDVRFSEDGHTLEVLSTEITGGWDIGELAKQNVVFVEHHPLGTRDLINQGCERLVRNFNPEEWKSYFGAEPYSNTCPGLPR